MSRNSITFQKMFKRKQSPVVFKSPVQLSLLLSLLSLLPTSHRKHKASQSKAGCHAKPKCKCCSQTCCSRISKCNVDGREILIFRVIFSVSSKPRKNYRKILIENPLQNRYSYFDILHVLWINNLFCFYLLCG